MGTPAVNFTPGQLARARECLRLEAADPASDAAIDIVTSLEEELGFRGCHALFDYAEAHPEAPVSTAKLSNLPSNVPSNVPVDENGIPKRLPHSKLPGYLLDAWGVPWRIKGQGRKEGKVRPDNRLYRNRQGELVHVSRYRLTIKGKRRDFFPKYLLRARLHAESEYREKLGCAENEKGEVRVC